VSGGFSPAKSIKEECDDKTDEIPELSSSVVYDVANPRTSSYFSHQPGTSCHVLATEMATPKNHKPNSSPYATYMSYGLSYPDAYNYIPIIYYDIPLGNRCIIVFSMEV
jgi:hypothetical protein